MGLSREKSARFEVFGQLNWHFIVKL